MLAAGYAVVFAQDRPPAAPAVPAVPAAPAAPAADAVPAAAADAGKGPGAASDSLGQRIDPRADAVLRAASQYLADAKSFTFEAETWQDKVLEGGRKLQSPRAVEVGVRRPDRCYSHARTPGRDREAWYDGKTVTVYNPGTHFYGSVAAPATIDEMVDFVGDRFRIPMPLSDLIVSDLYGGMTQRAQHGDYAGRELVGGVPCHHLAFRQEDIDWQVWIESGTRPLVRRIVITYKQEEQSPQWTATITHWNMDARLPDYAFVFQVPQGASRIDILPATAPAEAGVAQPAAGHESGSGAAASPAPPRGSGNQPRKE
jgi:hypothetical protein